MPNSAPHPSCHVAPAVLLPQLTGLHVLSTRAACVHHARPAPCAAAGREHLLFYARVKNLPRSRLRAAVEAALRGVNLHGVGDDLVGGYRCGLFHRSATLWQWQCKRAV